MKHRARLVAAALLLLVSLAVLAVSVETQDRGRGRDPLRVAASSLRDLRAWDQQVTRMERNGTLKLRKEQADTLVPGRKFIRLDQLHEGVPVWGGEVVVETDGKVSLSVLTNLYEGISIGTDVRLGAQDAKLAVERFGGAQLGPDRLPSLAVYPGADGAFRMTYTERVAANGDVRRFFVDAGTGDLVAEYSELFGQSAVGSGTGVLGDTKKLSTTLTGGTYVTDDGMRPPGVVTFDLRGNAVKAYNWLNGVGYLYASDRAADPDNVWGDPAVVDAHAHIGWAYDYFFKRFGRRGFDDHNAEIQVLVHCARRADFEYYYYAGLLPYFSTFFANAAYWGEGAFAFGEGLPPGWTSGGQHFDYLAGALDVVGHEFAHAVSDSSSHLAHTGDPRALSEAFSDMMGSSIEFYYRASRANYTMGDDVSSRGLRSLKDPASLGDGIDHYSRRGPAVGNEYKNSTIASHAFYLAIEGGTNRTSGMGVQGVGAANREQVEKAFYRGFTSLTSQATFGLARARTIESARALYGANSAAERAITEAWSAVGVF